MADLVKLLKDHLIFFIGIGIITALCIYVLLVEPHGTPLDIFDPTFGTGVLPEDISKLNFYNMVTFGLGLDSTILIWTIGLFLLYRWNKGGRSNSSLLVWGLGFLIYSITFIAHIFRAWGVDFKWANEGSSPEAFFILRFGMIIWAGASIYGILRILVEDKKKQIIPAIIVILAGIFWFIYGLFIAYVPDETKRIETMMYGFLFTIWIPICFSISYIFLVYGRKSNTAGPKILFVGYLGLTITYMAWAPWHFGDVIYLYFVWYFLFLLSLVPILIGFILLAKESEEK